ncbi:hypothetical protein SK128_004736 [Halocaridina rubra]|uniref:Uncharacterized protein n=1 Tax=Halocaridina rubra TaxID=373956 RepID=A0AAN8WRI2_HALRR
MVKTSMALPNLHFKTECEPFIVPHGPAPLRWILGRKYTGGKLDDGFSMVISFSISVNYVLKWKTKIDVSGIKKKSRSRRCVVEECVLGAIRVSRVVECCLSSLRSESPAEVFTTTTFDSKGGVKREL